jgi:hypothetical protein
MEKITFVMTSCDRYDLLTRTLDSFLELNTYPIHRYIIHEDSGNQETINKIKERYGHFCEIIVPEKGRCQVEAVDRLYNLVDTEYIFHCEEDWLFLNNPNFMSESLSILKKYPDINQVWLRNDAQRDWIEPQINFIDNIPFCRVKAPHLGVWNGFSWNPGLRRKSDYVRMFPNGFSEFRGDASKNAVSEYNCAVHSENFKYRAAILVRFACSHIGWGQSTFNH